MDLSIRVRFLRVILAVLIIVSSLINGRLQSAYIMDMRSLNILSNDALFITNEQFVFHPNIYGYDVELFLNQKLETFKYLGADMKPAAEAIKASSYIYSISPKVIITLLKVQSDTSGSKSLINLNSSSITGQIQLMAALLAQKFYENTFLDSRGYTLVPPSAASDAIKFFFYNEKLKGTQYIQQSELVDFVSTYKELFGDPTETISVHTSSLNTELEFHYPWAGEQNFWKLGSRGYHAGGFRAFPPGSTLLPNSTVINDGVDFLPPTKYTGSTDSCPGPSKPDRPEHCLNPNRGLSPDWLIAAADGEVVYRGWSTVVVKHNSEWATMYYHVGEQDMAQVGKLPNDLKIGHPSNAVTWGGSSTHSHVHFSIAREGILQDPKPYVEKFTTWNGAPISVTLYEHPNFQGQRLTLTSDDLDLCDNPLDPSHLPVVPCFTAPSWTNNASSIKVAPGWHARLHKHNEADAIKWGDDAEQGVYCGTDIPDFRTLTFPDGTPLDENVSRIYVWRCDGSTSVTSAGTHSTDDPCKPNLPDTTASDKAQFTNIETPTDSTVVAPNQTIRKTWRVKNTGNRIWGPDYKLVFIGGNQMGAPNEVNIPLTEPGGVADISIDITAPGAAGTHRGDWRLRNPQGTFFGDKLWVQIVVPETNNPQPTGMGLTCTNCPSTVTPGQSFRPTVRVSGSVPLLQSRGDMLRNTDGNRYGAWEFVAVTGAVNQGQSYDFTFYEQNPITAPNTEGVYESKWRVWQNGGWVGPELTIRFEVKAGGSGANHPPNAPTLTGPGDWAVYTGNGGINLQAQHNGDPDGDPVSQYYFEIFESAQNANSGWIDSNSWSPQGLGYNGYQWRVKVRDSRGAESGWSPQVWHFTVQTNEPQIYEFYSTQCHEPWGNTEQYCFCARTNAGTLRLQVNSATDGSDRGDWQVLNELGTTNYDCKSDNDRPPTWTQLEYETGTHLVRLYARRDGGWAAAASSDRTISLPPERRPNAPHEVFPRNLSYVDSRTVTLDWLDTLRTTGYRLQASTDPQWGSLLLDQLLPANGSQYTHTFAEEYAKVYWRVIATGPYGSNEASQEFYIDTTPPTSAVSPLPAITTDTKFNVSWGGSDARSGLRWYHVQVRDGNRADSQWSDWFVNTPKSGELFAGQPGHTYYFRVRAMDQVGNWEEWPPGEGDAYTVVNPAAAPPTAWWNAAYTHKRNLIIRNNDEDVMPAHYPIRLHFDDTTNPTAAEVYNGSIAPTKGADLRIIYNNQAELQRLVQRFTPSAIDLWFPLQTGLADSESNNGSYQLYYGNAGAGSPPSTINTIFLPEADGNTLGLWHFQEGSGDTVYDSSGRSHHGTLSNGSWMDGYLGNAVNFNGVNTTLSLGNHNDFNNGGAITLEAWIYPTRRSWAMVFMKGIDGYGHYRLNLTGDGTIEFVITTQGGERSILGSTSLQANQWYHVAGVHDGGNAMWIYVNGVQEREKTDAAPFSGRDYPLYIGNAPWWNGMAFAGLIQHARISNVARRDFPYARINIPPSVVAGSPIAPPIPGAPDLVVLGLNPYPNPDGGIIVEALVQNQGNRETQNGFYTDLYVDHIPSGAGDYTGSVQFWVNSPIAAGATVTLTTVLTDLTSNAIVAAQSQAPSAEITHTLSMQTDSAGVVPDADKTNNILSSGVEVCLASPDALEGDDEATQASTIVVDQLQRHNFSSAGDQDWVQFNAEAGQEYTFSTRNLGPAADTYLYLYDTNGTTLLTANDDTDTLASQIHWVAPTSATYYLLVRHWNPNVAGCGTSYQLIAEPIQIEATCMDKIPAQGIMLFTESTCAGKAKNFSTLGWLSLSNTEFNDNVSSITVAVGQSAEIFDNDSEETGLARCVTEWKWDLAKDNYFGTETAIDNTITSIKLYANPTCGKQFPVDVARCDAFTYDGVILFDYILCGGHELAINQPGEYPLAASQFNNMTGSIYIGEGWSMIVYAEPDFQGESTCLNWGPLWYLTADTYSQGGSSMYNTISSVKIFHDRICGATQSTAPTIYLPIIAEPKATSMPVTGVTVSGIVYHSTTPLSNVKVDLILGDVSNPLLASTSTNAEGKFVFSQVPPGKYSLKRYGLTSDYIDWNGSSLQVQDVDVAVTLDLPKRMTLVSPPKGTTVNTTTPTFCWQPLPTATKYTFQLNQSASWALIEQVNSLTNTCYTTTRTLQNNTQYTWQIDAYDDAGHWVGSTDNAFTLITN